VQQVNRAHLRLGNPVRTPEVEFDGGRLPLVVLDVLKYGIDFLLRKLSAQFVRPPARRSADAAGTLEGMRTGLERVPRYFSAIAA